MDRDMGYKTGRIEALSDGIFAIAMTILILSFETLFQQPVPGIKEKDLMDMMKTYLPDLLHYMESFIILGTFWYLHHRQFHFIKKVDAIAIFINIIALMFIALIPFSSVILGDYGNVRPAAILFECNLLLAGLTFFGHWIYVSHKHRFVNENMDVETVKFYGKRNMLIPVVSLLAGLVSFFQPRMGVSLYFAVPLILILWKRRDEQ